MFNLFKSKPVLDDFYQQHKLNAENEHLLNIGAMLFEYNQFRDSLTLKSRLKGKQLEPLLKNAWQITDKESCIELLDELIKLPNKHQHSDFVEAILIQRKNVHDLSYEVLVEPAHLYHYLERECQPLFEQSGAPFDRVQFDAIGDVSAWDIERAGLVTRYAHNIGWLNESETLAYLEKLHVLAKANYKTWTDYYVAYMKARTLFYEQRETEYLEYVLALKDMYKDPGFFCLKYPLHA